MSRLSKKKKKEYAFFLNGKNRITYNTICMSCLRECKQSFRAVLIACRNYQKKEK